MNAVNISLKKDDEREAIRDARKHIADALCNLTEDEEVCCNADVRKANRKLLRGEDEQAPDVEITP